MTNDLHTAVVTATEGSVRSDDGALELEVHEPGAESSTAGFTTRYVLNVSLPVPGTTPDDVLQQALAICPFTKTIAADSLEVRLA